MKLTFIFTFFSCLCFSQNVEIGKYYSGNSDEKFTVSCKFTIQETVDFYIQSNNNDNFLTKKNYLVIKQSELKDFKNALDTLISVYPKWKKLALENNIRDIDKKIQIPYVKAKSIFQYGEEYHTDEVIALKAIFFGKNGNYHTQLSSKYKQRATINNYIETEHLYFIFLNTKEIEELQELVDYDKALEALIAHEQKQNIFKQ